MNIFGESFWQIFLTKFFDESLWRIFLMNLFYIPFFLHNLFLFWRNFCQNLGWNFWWIFWFFSFLTKFLDKIFEEFFDEFFDNFLWQFLRPIFWRFFWQFFDNFCDNFFDDFFDNIFWRTLIFWKIFLTNNLLTVGTFRLRVCPFDLVYITQIFYLFPRSGTLFWCLIWNSNLELTLVLSCSSKFADIFQWTRNSYIDRLTCFPISIFSEQISTEKRYKDRKSMSREIGFSIVVSNTITTWFHKIEQNKNKKTSV